MCAWSMTCSSSQKIKDFPEPVGKINENVNFAFDNFWIKLKQVLRSAKDTAVWSNKRSKVIGGHFWREIKGVFLSANPKTDFDPRFSRFRGRKEREIRKWICNLGNLSPTRAICTTASQKMTCFLLFDKLCDYTVQNLVVGSSNSDDGTYKTDKERMSASLIQFHSSDFFM